MDYVVSDEFVFDIFDDGDVMASNTIKPKSFLLNKTTWFVVCLFIDCTSYNDAKQKFINYYNKDKNFLSDEFESIFGILLKNNVIKGV